MYPNERSSLTDISNVYASEINPFLHLKQHWYIGILLEWILEEFSCVLTTITIPRKNIIASFFVTVITKFDIKLILLRLNSLISQWKLSTVWNHDDIIKWKHFPRFYWPFVRGIHRSPLNSSHKGQWRGALMFSLICAWINAWVNNREAGDLGRHRARYGVIAMAFIIPYGDYFDTEQSSS